MRTLMKVKIPTAAGNEAIKNGSLPEIIGKALATLNAEAAYFTRPDEKSFERPYGWAWLLKLTEELQDWDEEKS